MPQQMIVTDDFVNDAAARQILRRAIGPKGMKVYSLGQQIQDPQERGAYYSDIIRSMRGELDWRVVEQERKAFRQRPVSVRKFFTDSFYMGGATNVYPKVLNELEDLNNGAYVEAVLTGGIGSGKTTMAHYTLAYQIYVLSCMRDPHAYFDLDKSSEIMFVLQSLSAQHAKNLEYTRFRSLMEKSHYFSRVFPFDKDILSRMIFPNRIEVTYVSGQETATIGQNVIGGLLDEVNYMAIVEESKSNPEGGGYDQAWALYNSITRRRKSRFLKNGKAYGMLCLISSKRFPGQFTDKKEEEAQRQMAERGSTDIFVYDKRAWDIAPADRYSGEKFRIFIGDDFRNPRILWTTDTVAEEDQHLVMEIPIEYRNDFDQDIIKALRDIAGVSTLAAHPFILDAEAVAECMSTGHRSIFSRDMTDFEAYPLKVYPKRIKNPEAPRAVHIDLSVSNDSTGVTIGHVEKFVEIDRGDTKEIWPRIVIDGQLEIIPPRNSEIKFYKIRELLYKLRERGLNIRWVTFDSYQSIDSMQVLKQKGFTTGYCSMDTSIRPYSFAKGALYDRRVSMDYHEVCRRELLSIEYDTKTGKIDHPANGSKDVADSFAGVVYRLTVTREIWSMHGYSPDYMPESVKSPKKEEL